METQVKKLHKVNERPFAEGSRDFRGARAQCKKDREIKHFGWHAFPVNENDRVVPNTFHARYIIGGSQTENKVYSFSTILSLSMANHIHGCLPYQHFPRNLLFNNIK